MKDKTTAGEWLQYLVLSLLIAVCLTIVVRLTIRLVTMFQGGAPW